MGDRNMILIGVDAGWRHSSALEWALREAIDRRMPLRAVHVVDDRLRRTYSGPVEIDGQTVTVAPVAEHDTAILADLQSHLTAADPDLDLAPDLLVGPPDERLAELSADYELTVVGRRGLGGFTRLLIGSTSEAVASHGAGPVVVVPDGWDPDRHAGAPIVAGVDRLDDGEQALEFAFETASSHHVPLWLVHAWAVPEPFAWDDAVSGGGKQRWKDNAQRRLDQVAEQWQAKYPDVEVRRLVREMHPVKTLLDAAASADAQLIVVGGHRHNRVSGLLLGSVARGVLHHADIPVAVVHERRA